MYICIFGFKGASTSKVIGAHNEMLVDGYDGQMIFGDLVGLMLSDIRLTGEEKPRKNLTQETCPERGSNPGPLRDKRARYHLFHSGGLFLSMYMLDLSILTIWTTQMTTENLSLNFEIAKYWSESQSAPLNDRISMLSFMY